jgi:hypothetical protein
MDGQSVWFFGDSMNQGRFYMRIKLTFWVSLFWVAFLTLNPQSSKGAGACTAALFNSYKDCGCHQVPGGNEVVCKICPVTKPPKGMPRWWVDEPYINLHISDTPLSYKTSSGQEIAFTFNYKHRYMLPPRDQCPDAYVIGTSVGVRQGIFDHYMIDMRNHLMTNSAWMHNWMMDVTFWDSRWEAVAMSQGFSYGGWFDTSVAPPYSKPIMRLWSSPLLEELTILTLPRRWLKPIIRRV